MSDTLGETEAGFSEAVLDATAQYLYDRAQQAVGYPDIHDIYMDAADAITDVIAMWHTED